MAHGLGKLINQEQKVVYEGNWLNDKFHGQGILYNLNENEDWISYQG